MSAHGWVTKHFRRETRLRAVVAMRQFVRYRHLPHTVEGGAMFVGHYDERCRQSGEPHCRYMLRPDYLLGPQGQRKVPLFARGRNAKFYIDSGYCMLGWLVPTGPGAHWGLLDLADQVARFAMADWWQERGDLTRKKSAGLTEQRCAILRSTEEFQVVDDRHAYMVTHLESLREQGKLGDKGLVLLDLLRKEYPNGIDKDNISSRARRSAILDAAFGKW